MEERISDIDMHLEWGRTGETLKVYVKNGGLLSIDVMVYNSITGFASPLLSPRQVKWITEDYEKKRKKYVFV